MAKIITTLPGGNSSNVVSDPLKLDKSTYTGNAQELDTRIDILENLPLASSITAETGFSLVGLVFTVNSLWTWILNGINYTNVSSVIINIPLCTTGNKRIDYVVPNNSNGFTRIAGVETTGTLQAPSIPVKGMYVSWFIVTDSLIETPNIPNLGNTPSLEDVITVNPYSLKPFTVQEKLSDTSSNSGVNVTPRYISLWNWLGGVTKYARIKWDNIGVNTTFQLPNKADNSTETFAMVSDLDTKLDISAYNQHFKGVYLTEVALNTAHPTASVGDYAQVNEVGATDVVNYNWDAEDSIWVTGGGTGGAANTDALPEGTSQLYFQTARVLATLLTGISFVTGGAIVSTDSVLVAFGKLQKQITDFNTTANIKSLLGITTLSGSNTGDQDLILPVTETGTSFSLTDGYNGKVVILTASCTVTIPNGLIAGFEVSIVTLAGVTLTIALGGSVVLFNNAGLIMAEKLSCTFKNRIATNNYITSGNL